MTDEKLSFTQWSARLRKTGLRFVLFSNDNEITDGLAKKHAFLRKLRARQPIFTTSLMSLYDLDLIKP